MFLGALVERYERRRSYILRWSCWLAGSAALATPWVVAGQAPSVSAPTAIPASRSAIVLVREATVIAGDANVSVSRQAVTPVIVTVETNAGTYVVAGDSAAIARWADSADVLPVPPAFAVKKHRATLKAWRVRAEHDAATSMQFMRVPASNGSDIELTLSNGAWETFELLGAERQQVFAALRGVGLDTTDTAHVRVKSSPATSRTCPTAIGPTGSGSSPDTDCIKPRVEKQACSMADNPHPVYPGALQQAGVSGEVVLEFVIDATGKINKRTVHLMRSTRPEFALAVLHVLDRLRFCPAEVDGHKVEELVDLPFGFLMMRR
jgi:TonB family protein